MRATSRPATPIGRQPDGPATPDRLRVHVHVQVQVQAVARRRDAAYRRLAVTIVGLDVPTLADELRAARRARRPARLPAAA